jgi:hypothetical protein
MDLFKIKETVIKELIFSESKEHKDLIEVTYLVDYEPEKWFISRHSFDPKLAQQSPIDFWVHNKNNFLTREIKDGEFNWSREEIAGILPGTEFILAPKKWLETPDRAWSNLKVFDKDDEMIPVAHSDEYCCYLDVHGKILRLPQIIHIYDEDFDLDKVYDKINKHPDVLTITRFDADDCPQIILEIKTENLPYPKDRELLTYLIETNYIYGEGDFALDYFGIWQFKK